MPAPLTPFAQFQNLLREMFQFDHNELDFGLFKVLRLKRTYIEQFISDMMRKHVLHLHWAPEVNGKRVDEDGDTVPPPPDGRCYVERMLTCAGLLKPY